MLWVLEVIMLWVLEVLMSWVLEVIMSSAANYIYWRSVMKIAGDLTQVIVMACRRIMIMDTNWS